MEKHTKSTGTGPAAKAEQNAREAAARREYGLNDNGDPLGEDEWLLKCKREFAAALEAESEDRIEAEEDDRFKLGGKNQWPEYAQKSRTTAGYERPMFTLNEVAKFANNVGNDIKQNKPQIKLVPGDEAGAKETADVMTDLIRHILSRGQGDWPLESAAQQAVDGGWGYAMVTASYIDDTSNQQELEVKSIANRFTVYPDPHAQTPWLEDMEYCFLSWEVHKDDLPPEARGEWEGGDDHRKLWVSEKGDDYRRIAVKWWRGPAQMIRVPADTGENEREADRRQKDDATQYDDDRRGKERRAKSSSAYITRKSVRRPVYYQEMTGNMVLGEPQEWPGTWIPIVRVVGEATMVDGALRKKGIIRDSKDPQRIVNFEYTEAVEDVALGVKTGALGAEGQFEGHQEAWELAMRRPVATLEYKPIAIQEGDQLVMTPPPELNPRAAVPDANITMMQLSHQMLRETTGVMDVQLGQQSNEQSGRAINARRSQGGQTTAHYMDNMLLALRHLGKILVDLIPHYYDTPRMQRIQAENGDQSMVLLDPTLQKAGQDVAYQEYQDTDEVTAKPKVTKKYRLDVGRYDVRVTTGKSYANRQQEMVESLGGSLSVLGDNAILVLPEWYEAMDWPGADRISELLRMHRDKLFPHTVKPNAGEEGDPREEAQQLRAVVQQLVPQMQEMAQEMERMGQELQSKQMETDAKILIARLKFMSELVESEGMIKAEQLRGFFKMAESKAKIQNPEYPKFER